MNRNNWEATFWLQLKAQLDIVPEQINFRWQMYFSERYTPEQAIAHLIEIHGLLPTQEVLPMTTGIGLDNATPLSALVQRLK